MTNDEIREVVRDVLKEIREEDEFHIPRKEFYDQHQRVKSFVSAFDSAAATVGKVVLGLVVMGVIAILMIGAGWKK